MGKSVYTATFSVPPGHKGIEPVELGEVNNFTAMIRAAAHADRECGRELTWGLKGETLDDWETRGMDTRTRYIELLGTAEPGEWAEGDQTVVVVRLVRQPRTRSTD